MSKSRRLPLKRANNCVLRPDPVFGSVDDQEPTRNVLRMALESRGVNVHEARDGVDALALLEQEPVDAIVSDVLMPRMDGYRLCQEIRAHLRFFSLPFIFHTETYVSPSDAAFSLRVGADKFLKKPTTLDLLFAALEEAAGAVRHPSSAPRRSRSI